MRQVTEAEWSSWLMNKENYHLLQSPQWGILKEKFGWSAVRVLDEEAGAQILFRSLPMGLRIAYIPKGPIGIVSPNFWEKIDDVCKSKKSVFLKVEPDLWEGETFTNTTFINSGFIASNSIQPRRTIVVDLTGTEETWLSRMKQKTRYNIKLAEKKEIRIVESENVDIFYKIMISTGNRDNFGIHSKTYYKSVFDLFKIEEKVALFIAYFQDTPLAGLMAFREGNRAWYFYGASNEMERNRMPTYLLQLYAMRWARKFGCESYDLWGIPDSEEEILEKEFTPRSDGLWGVYRFKRGFGGIVRRYESAFDRIYIPSLYKLYQLYTLRRSLI
jgi:lipid II:glycine glycyltransferase (peptidoglycan interpeptide bridge formation enzyme)